MGFGDKFEAMEFLALLGGLFPGEKYYVFTWGIKFYGMDFFFGLGHWHYTSLRCLKCLGQGYDILKLSV